MPKFLAKIKMFFIKFLGSLKSLSLNVFSRLKGINYRAVINRKTKIVILVIGILLFVAEIGFGVMIYGFKSENKYTKIAARIIPYPMVVANYDVITYNDYLKEKEYIHFFYNATQQDAGDLAAVDKQILDQLIEAKLIKEQAFLNRVKVTNKDVDATIEEIASQNGGQSQVEKVLQDLYGLKLNEFKRLVRTQLLRNKVNDELIAKVKASHILIRAPKDSTKEQIEAARVKAEGVKKEISDGLNFAEAAKKYSEDTSSAEQGGELDYFAKGEMVQEFSDAAFSTKVGEVSSPILTEFGWHVIKVEAKKGKIDMKFTDWIEELRAKSIILRFVK